MGFMAYSPLGRGFFGGAVHDAKDMSDGDGRINHPRFQGDNLAKNLALLARFEELAREKALYAGAVGIGMVNGSGQRGYSDPQQ